MAPKIKTKKSKGESEEEKLIREEDDKKQRDAEAKVIADEAERLSEEHLRIQTERKNFRATELATLNEENVSVLEKLSSLESRMAAEIFFEAEDRDWAKYRDPAGEPDASSERDMNTFLSLTSDIHLTSMMETMDFVRKMEAVASSLQVVYSNSLADGNLQILSRSSGYIQQILNMITLKVDSATAHMLRFVDHHMNEKSEIFVEELASQVSMGVWASYSDVRLIRKSIQFEKMGIQLDVPKQVLNQDARYVHRIIRIPIDSSNTNFMGFSISGTKPLKWSKKRVLGDIIQIDILLPPPQAFTIRAKKWTVRDNSAAAFMVQRSAYPSSVGSRCYFKVPSDVLMSDDVRIGLWDSENKDWTKEGLSDFQYSESTRMAQFHIAAVGTIALVRESVWEMPYKSWSLKATRNVNEEIDVAVVSTGVKSMVFEVGGSHFERQACFTLQTANHELVINIIGTHCVLISPVRTEFSDLIGVRLSPGLLLTKLQRRGVNLLPTADDLASVADIVPKDATICEEVILQMSRCSSAFDFQSSSWSQTLPCSQIGLLVRESTVYTGVEDVGLYDFECVLAEVDNVSKSCLEAPDVGNIPSTSSGVKFTLVVGNTYGDEVEYSSSPRPGESSHLGILGAVDSRISPEASNRVDRCNVRFQKTVYTLLKLINPLAMT